MESIQEFKNLRANMQMLNFNVCKEELEDRTKTQTTRQDKKSRFNKGDYTKLIWKGKKEICVVRIKKLNMFKFKRTRELDYINGEPYYLCKKLKDLARKDGFGTVEEYLDKIHQIYDCRKEKVMRTYEWRWL